MDQKIKELADSFFEWPTENKSFVTLTSALLFTEDIAEITRKEERERCALLCERVGTETGECPEAYQYCADAIRTMGPLQRGVMPGVT